MKTFIFFFLFPTILFAVTPDEIRRLALERSSLIPAQEMEARALRSEAELRGKWQNPQLMGQFGTLKSGSVSGSTTEVSLTQAVPLSDKFSLRKEVAQLAASQQSIQSEYFKNWVGHQAILSAWRVQVGHELLKHGIERNQRLKLVKSYMETRPRVSVRHRVELSLISNVLLQLGREQDLKEQSLSLALADLEFWTGKKFAASEINFPIPDPSKLTETAAGKTENSPDIKRVELEMKIAARDKELAQKERRPDIFLGGGYRVENVVPMNHFSYAIVGLNIPLWDTGSSRLETARARLMKSEKMLEETQRETDLKIKKQVIAANFNLSQVKRFPQALIRKTEHTIREGEQGFKQGVLDVNTFIQAETQSHEVIDQVWLVWISYLETLSDLALTQGQDLIWEKL